MLATCNFCGNPASLGPMPKLWLCRGCAKRIGALASTAQHGSASRVWSTDEWPRHAALHEPASNADVPVERVLQEFKAGVATQVAADDFEIRLDIAEAYREMGLHVEALREVGVVLTRASGRVAPLATKMTEIALRVVLTPPLLKPTGLVQLKAILHRPS